MSRFILPLLLFFMLQVTAQKKTSKNEKWERSESTRKELYQLRDKIASGDYASLQALAPFLDDTSFVQEFLGHHNYPNTARNVALRILHENTLFLPEELELDSSLNAARFLSFLQQHKVVFNDLCEIFLLTPPEKRQTTYQLKQLSDYDIKQLATDTLEAPYPGWYYENQLDGFLVQKNPQAMVWIAAEWYQRRSRFNVYYFDDEDFRNLLRRLTHLDIGVPNARGEFTFLYDDDYYAQAKLNLLVYWANHYQDYRWNDQLGYFENTKEKGMPKSREEILFPALLEDDDTAALLAFRELAQLDPVIIKNVIKDYDRISLDRNYALPTFPFDFLPPLATLTQYCRNNGFSYTLPAWLEDSLALVADFPHFAVKYRVENNILDRLSIADITALEFYGLTGNDYDRATFSLGRILDKFYSLHLEEISSDPKQLSLFLLKAKLFNELGIIGNCNKYMKKFERCKPVIIDRVKQLQQTTEDTLMRQLCEKALTVHANYKPWQVKIPSRGESYNEVYGVADLEAKYSRLLKKFPDPEKRVMHVPVLMGDISYSQIGQAVKLLLKDTAVDRYYRFHFLEADFGIPFDSFEEDTINAFLSAYALYNEKDLYAYYLKRNGIRCFDNAGNLDFTGVYDMLKYGVVDAFQGGGGGKRDDGVYAVIKLLEFHFNTRLGFARKRCKSGYGYSCSTTTEAAAAWMQFLEAKKLVTGVEQEPISFSPNK